jgi:hypothetical protein
LFHIIHNLMWVFAFNHYPALPDQERDRLVRDQRIFPAYGFAPLSPEQMNAPHSAPSDTADDEDSDDSASDSESVSASGSKSPTPSQQPAAKVNPERVLAVPLKNTGPWRRAANYTKVVFIQQAELPLWPAAIVRKRYCCCKMKLTLVFQMTQELSDELQLPQMEGFKSVCLFGFETEEYAFLWPG